MLRRLFDAVLQTMMSSLRYSAAGHLNHLSSVVLTCGIMQHPLDARLVPLVVEAFCRDSTASEGREVSCRSELPDWLLCNRAYLANDCLLSSGLSDEGRLSLLTW